MKMTRLSLIAALAMSAAFAGGDIVLEEEVVETVACNSDTTINGKAQAYSLTDDFAGNEFYQGDSSRLGLAATLDVSHKVYDGITANFSAVGYTNLTNVYFEGRETGAFFNVANITANFADTTFVLGRQLLNTPMLSGFDWLLAPGSFEAYTVVNKSIENVTFVASYVEEWRANNAGDNWLNLSDLTDGNNWTVSAAYDNNALSASVWYYNVDAGSAIAPASYTQVYADAGYKFGDYAVAAMFVNTDYDNNFDASNAFGVKATATVASIDLMAAYVNVSDNVVGFVGALDNLYTSSWNTGTNTSLGNNFKVEAATTFADVKASVSYAYYEYATLAGVDNDEDGQEIDVILGYDITNCISAAAIYTNTDNLAYGLVDNVNTLELIATYKF